MADEDPLLTDANTSAVEAPAAMKKERKPRAKKAVLEAASAGAGKPKTAQTARRETTC